MQPKYVSSTELAEHFSVSVPTVRLWMRKHKIPPNLYVKVGTAYRFMLAEIEQHFFDENARRRAAKAGGPMPEEAPVQQAAEPVIEESVVEEEQELLPFDADDDL